MRKRTIHLFIFLFLLASCAPPVTVASQVTVTSTPPSTRTPIPTPTVHPQFTAVQENLAQSEIYTLNQNGEIEMQTPDGMTIVPDIQVQPDGIMTFTHDGQEFTVDTDTLVINWQTITFKDQDGKTWVWDGESLHEKAEFKEYQICKIENFRDCTIPVEDLFNGNYLRWLQTLSKPFSQSQIKNEFNFEYVYTAGMTPHAILYNGNAPFRRDITFAQVLLEKNGKIYPYIVKPVEFYDKNDPENNKWVITVDSVYNENPEYSYPADWVNEHINKFEIENWKKKMNLTPIAVTTTGSSIWEDPLARQTFDDHPDMATRFERFIGGDVSALYDEESPIVLLTVNGNYWR